MNFDVDTILFTLSVWVIPVLLAITFHEAAHGFVAHRRGDDTAYRLGRVTFNPLRHIDPFGTVLLPALLFIGSGGRMLFGFAKPVPVNFANLRQPRRDMVLVAAAGPAINVAMAVVAAAAMHLVPLLSGDVAEWVAYNLRNAVWINVLLAVFNMLPVPPLDGGRVAVGLLPPELAMRWASLERYGIFIVLGGIFLLPYLGAQVGLKLDVFGWLVLLPASLLAQGILTLVNVA